MTSIGSGCPSLFSWDLSCILYCAIYFRRRQMFPTFRWVNNGGSQASINRICVGVLRPNGLYRHFSVNVLRTFNNEMNQYGTRSFDTYGKASSDGVSKTFFLRVIRNNDRRTNGSLCVNAYHIRFSIQLWIPILVSRTKARRGRICTSRLFCRIVRI